MSLRRSGGRSLWPVAKESWTTHPRVVKVRSRSAAADLLVRAADNFRVHRTGRNATLVAHFGFLSVFPLFLVLTTVLGFVLQNYPKLQERIIESAFNQVPIIGQQVERMRRQIDWHLAHARAAASGATPGTATALQPSIDGLVRTLARLHADKGLRMTADVAPDLTVRVQREDLEEMLGNLLDNACKWGRAHVTVTATRDGESITITVEDDGPGLAEDLRERVLQRGVRADEQSPGTGFGLAIVRDLAELHGGSIRLEGATAGGLRAVLRLPAAG